MSSWTWFRIFFFHQTACYPRGGISGSGHQSNKFRLLERVVQSTIVVELKVLQQNTGKSRFPFSWEWHNLIVFVILNLIQDLLFSSNYLPSHPRGCGDLPIQQVPTVGMIRRATIRFLSICHLKWNERSLTIQVQLPTSVEGISLYRSKWRNTKIHPPPKNSPFIISLHLPKLHAL